MLAILHHARTTHIIYNIDAEFRCKPRRAHTIIDSKCVLPICMQFLLLSDQLQINYLFYTRKLCAAQFACD